MLKRTIQYEDLDGNNIVEDFYFNLSEAEIAEMEMSQEGGLANHLKAILAEGNPRVILSTFKMIITASVGRRSDDGRRFIKNDQIREEFMQTDAYSKLFMELCTDAKAAAEFIQKVIPQNIADRVKLMEIENVQLPASVKMTIDDFSDEQLLAMTDEEFFDIVDPKKTTKRGLTLAMRRLSSE